MRYSPKATTEQIDAAREFLAVISDDDLATFDGEWVRVFGQPQWWFRNCLDFEFERRGKAAPKPAR